MPVGTILPYQGNDSDIPEKWHLCDGSAGTPDLRDGRFLEGSSSAKSWHSAGLPNIVGNFGPFHSYNATDRSEGAFYKSKTNGKAGPPAAPANTTYDWKDVGFDASRSSSIYGGSSTVQPKSYTVKFIMKIKA